MESIWDQWWFRLALWICAFSVISQVSPTPIIPGVFLIGSFVVWVLSKILIKPKRYDSDPMRYYRGA